MRKKFLYFSAALGLAAAALPSAPGQAATPMVTNLVSFYGATGASPETGVIADARGNLFGTTSGGGANAMGTVFEILKTRTGYDTSPTILLDFDGTNGAEPFAGLLLDAQGNLFGASESGGSGNAGTVFEIVKTKGGYASTPTILFNFDGTHGATPAATLIADGQGNLFGTTDQGGTNGMGTVFEIEKIKGGYASTPTILFSFDGTHGANPLSSLAADARGNLFGTTYFGGASNDGTIFEIPKTAQGYAATPTVLANFSGTDGENAAAGAIFDSHGNLFGTTVRGGANNYGTVFELARTNDGYASAPTTLVSFDSANNGAYPSASLIADANDDLFGTTSYGGADGLGTIFEVAKTNGGYANVPTILFSFNSLNGAHSSTNLLADSNGDLFGTATTGGGDNKGVVFELTGSGFVTQVFAGTPGSSDCYGESVLALQQQDPDLDAAAAARGLGQAEVLQTAIQHYCAASAP